MHWELPFEPVVNSRTRKPASTRDLDDLRAALALMTGVGDTDDCWMPIAAFRHALDPGR